MKISKMLKIKPLKPITGKKLLDYLIVIMFVAGTCGISLKFVATMIQSSYYGLYVYFPIFPNILDSIFLMVSVFYLAWRLIRNEKSQES